MSVFKLKLFAGLLLIHSLFVFSCKDANSSVNTSPTITTIYLVGDSTMADYTGNYSENYDYIKDRYPAAGWGQEFQPFLTSDSLQQIKNLVKTDSVFVDNRARGGRSSRTFFQEGRWRNVYENLKKDDIVLIQFGHNDSDTEKPERFVNIEAYKEYLTLFVNQTLEKKALPFLLTPVATNYPWESGILKNAHGEYDLAVKSLAKKLGVYCIDLNQKSRDFFTQKGEPFVTNNYYMNLPANTYEAFPNGLKDNGHFQIKGGIEVARLVFESLKEMNSTLNN